MVGKAAERGGAIKHSKMIQAVANARVPKFTIVLGGSFGAGNYGMCGRGFDPRFIFSLALGARTAVMGGAQAAKVMDIVNRGKLERAGQPQRRSRAGGDERPLGQRLDERPRCSAPRACGTTASSTRATRAACSACAWTRRRRSRRAPPASQQLRRCPRFEPPHPGDPGHEVHPEHEQIADTVRPFVAKEINRTWPSGRRRRKSPATRCSRSSATWACWASSTRPNTAAWAWTSATRW